MKISLINSEQFKLRNEFILKLISTLFSITKISKKQSKFNIDSTTTRSISYKKYETIS